MRVTKWVQQYHAPALVSAALYSAPSCAQYTTGLLVCGVIGATDNAFWSGQVLCQRHHLEAYKPAS